MNNIERSGVSMRHENGLNTAAVLHGNFQRENAPSRPYKLIHISDPHLSRQYYREHIKSLKLLLRSILDAGCDHLVITGDIVSTADPDDYYLARELFASYGLLHSGKLTVVPGNHDIFGGPHRAVEVLSFPQHIRSVDYYRRMELFKEAFAECFDGAEGLIPGRQFPFVKKAGPFEILGLNSIAPWSLWDNPLGSNGVLDDEQFSALENLGTEKNPEAVRVVALHHHFNNLHDDAVQNSLWHKIESRTMRMKKRRKTIRLLGALKVSLVLHGHIHRNEIYSRNNLTFACGAGAVCDDPNRFLKYNEILHADSDTRISMVTLAYPYQVSSVGVSQHRFRSVRSIPQFATGGAG
ncbi:MAG: metallophosphoesterase [Ignavibacteriales bacterium]|nr:metallophosphoesterase [Ignavibacteriales bacterium]